MALRDESHSIAPSGNESADHLQFLITLEPRWRSFFSSIAAVFSTPSTRPTSPLAAGDFWADVFVSTGTPAFSLLESAIYHGLGIVAVVWLSQFSFRPAPQLSHKLFDSKQLIYYDVS